MIRIIRCQVVNKSVRHQTSSGKLHIENNHASSFALVLIGQILVNTSRNRNKSKFLSISRTLYICSCFKRYLLHTYFERLLEYESYNRYNLNKSSSSSRIIFILKNRDLSCKYINRRETEIRLIHPTNPNIVTAN